MNKGNNSSNKSVKSSTKIIPRLLIGGTVLGLLYFSYKKSKEKRLGIKGEDHNESQATENESLVKTTEDNENKTYAENEVIKNLLNLIQEDPVFGPEDLYINNQIDKDFDENNQSYIKVDYISEDLLDGKEDAYISVILKIEDTLYKKNRSKDFYDRDTSIKNLRNTIFEVKSRKPEYKKLKYKIEPLSFYFYSEGVPGELMDIKDMRELKSISGFRYIRVKFLEVSEVGIKFVKDVLHELHPDGGEEDCKFNITPFVINYDSGDVVQLKDNYVSNDYLDNGERYKK